MVVRKKAVLLRREKQKTITTMNTQNLSFEELRAMVNRNFRIKVHGIVNGVMRNVLVGVSGLLEVLGGSVENLKKFVSRAFASEGDKCACKIYGGAMITFYVK